METPASTSVPTTKSGIDAQLEKFRKHHESQQAQIERLKGQVALLKQTIADLKASNSRVRKIPSKTPKATEGEVV
jgi:phage shock protein A